jgi:hypothetical protein
MDTPYWIPAPCENGHVFVWGSNTTIDKFAPRGVICQCGKYLADGKGGILDEEEDDHK